MRRTAVLSAAFFLLALGAALADDAPSSPVETAIHDVISKQLDAFRTEDGAAAEAF